MLETPRLRCGTVDSIVVDGLHPNAPGTPEAAQFTLYHLAPYALHLQKMMGGREHGAPSHGIKVQIPSSALRLVIVWAESVVLVDEARSVWAVTSDCWAAASFA